MPKVKDISNQRFGKLVAIKPIQGGRRVRWLCRCDCGRETVVLGTMLRFGNTKSCGCRRTDVLVERNTTHGLSKTRTYKTWKRMISRCCNTGNKDYARYGGRGISVCARWRKSFVNFLADMGHAPPKLEIDRIDNDGDYTPKNCRWATRAQQIHNSSKCRNITHNGKTMTVGEWTKLLGVHQNLLHKRLYRGWTIAETIDTPAGQKSWHIQRARSTTSASRPSPTGTPPNSAG